MELAPCNETSRQMLVDTLDRIAIDGDKQAEYIVKLFPNVLPDVARSLIEQATRFARQQKNDDPAEAVRQQLKPFFTFGFLLGKSPQITSLMYTYFEQSSFQPLPEEFFKLHPDDPKCVVYTQAAFSDLLVRDILKTYIKYLIFNPKLFSSVWNWSELGRIVALHPNYDLKYLAACNLSIITQPSRYQHMSMLRNMVEDNDLLIDLQIKYCSIYDNVFTPLIESNPEKREQIMDAYGGRSKTGYSFDSQTLTNIVNILLLKHDISASGGYKNSYSATDVKSKVDLIIKNYIPVSNLSDSISKTAYAASINKPCLIRGPPGCGKTAMIDYIAAQTNRVGPPVYVKVQVGDQIDSKLLVGSYVCTEIPGQFEWQPGPLTQAMAYGSWIVFEDIDLAPSEMAQVIHSVIENGNLSCVSCCPIKIDSPHPDFRIFFTQRTRDNVRSLRLGFGFIERLCDIVDVPLLTRDDVVEIIKKRYNFGSHKDDLIEKIVQIYELSGKLAREADISRAPRLVTLRDLFKFCDRISQRTIQQSDSGKYSQSDLDGILAESIDCYLGFLPEKFRVEQAKSIGQVLNKPADDIDGMILRRKPEIRTESNLFSVGRVRLDVSTNSSHSSHSALANTRQSVQLLESVAMCIKNKEPVLLVGETGVGKTTIIQHLASCLKTDLVVMNLSQQSDSSDLLGGYRPVDMREVISPINAKFTDLFGQTFDVKENCQFLTSAEKAFITAEKVHQWLSYLLVINKICGRAIERLSKDTSNKDLYEKWSDLFNRVRRLSRRMEIETTAPMALSFAEGALLRAVRKGKWILLDEINLAEPDVLQCLLLILDSLKDSHVYMQGADTENEGVVKIHPNFRIFACMNPSTDIGKRDLPASSRARFTEFFVDDITERHELRLIVESYVKTCLSTKKIESVVQFYQNVRDNSIVLSDITGHSPVFSLRTLCRALMICANNVCRDMEKSLFESLMVTFLQQLNGQSVRRVMKMLESTVFSDVSIASIIAAPIKMPQDNHQYAQIEDFWIQMSSQKKIDQESYILTQSVKANLKRICRIISMGQRKLPILIQGNTSVGKTSLIRYLAQLTGNHCYRINNHEHTDLQDYVGRYVLRESGELQFQDGLLVTAMKKGYWVILDELNLAPSDLLEALNRVLDDNRELFIPETRELIRAHSKFMIFATQNPPEEYAGRKLLSRAFRNRFIELNFDEIPHAELEEILSRRCKMPPQYAKKIVTVMRELQVYRRESGCFSGKNSFMTMRDLFRWGERYLAFKDTIPDTQTLDWEEFLAGEGLILLEGRVRTCNEADIVKSILEKIFKRKLNRDSIYKYSLPTSVFLDPKFKHIDLTDEYRRTFVQLSQALKYKEPVLLCGQTGCGKTTATQIIAKLTTLDLITYNCHLNTECSDFVGNTRPARQDDESQNGQQKFPWVDGPLVEAMKKGAIFLLDEISLADDAVLERLNSVLEPERSITLTEKDGTQIIAHENFRFVATMNPGGDYGKKELSPALRNRFTEIYCHNPMDVKQIMLIVEKKLAPNLLKPKIAPSLLEIIKRFLKSFYREDSIISLRDVLSWIEFINRCTMVTQILPLSVQKAIIDGAHLVFFDQFGTCGHKASRSDKSNQVKQDLLAKLERLVESKFGNISIFADKVQYNPMSDEEFIKMGNYCIRKGSEKGPITGAQFIFDAPSVHANSIKIVRALQLDRPILLEGDPGAGKTSIVEALARKVNHKLVRINLSEQTDISDLFGSDLPDISNLDDDHPKFCWHDGPLLAAIKESSWILLDEMNLASQSVLEGLNACFDHRGEIFIPELNRKFTVDRSSTRIFACQNPYDQGAARKGLPQSFLNRFTAIYIESHTDQDLSVVLRNLYPDLPEEMICKMIAFNNELNSSCRMQGYEFNLRDLIYWCDLTTKYVSGESYKILDLYEPERFVQFVYIDRLRSLDEKNQVCDIFETVFGYSVYEPPYRELKLGETSLVFSRAILSRKKRLPPHLSDLCMLKYQMPYIESIAKAIELGKMPILVGETGSGKRSIVKILAGLTGNQLNVIAANRDMDVVELLGSFEQKSLQREIVDLVQDANMFVIAVINAVEHRSQDSSWIHFYRRVWSTLYASSIRDLRSTKAEMMEAYRFQLNQMNEILKQLKALCTETTENRRKALQKRVKTLLKKYLIDSESTYSSGNFEWIDSVLVKSIKEGHWLMIENANLMNPATLDRLNSLVEPQGSLTLNEKGSSQNGVEVLKPHKDFRLILTMNHEFGELSRAMRNRGVEIYVRTRFYFEDFLMLLKLNGFKPTENTSCLSYCIMQTCYDTHLKVTGEEAVIDGGTLAYFGLNYLHTLAQQIRRGVLVEDILADLLQDYYRRKGFLEMNVEGDTIRTFVCSKMAEYKQKYVVDLNDDRYKWSYFMHDLVSMTGGDATLAMLVRENRLFWDSTDPVSSNLLKMDELIDCLDIVNTCTTVKIFMDLSTQGDFEYRKGFIKYIFTSFPKLTEIVNRQVQLLHEECMPIINSETPPSDLIPKSEMYVDTRNHPDMHYYLQAIDYQGTACRVEVQNRWLLSLHRYTIEMIIKLIEDRTMETPGFTNLWTLSEQVRVGEALKEDLIRPQAEIAVDLYDFLIGILRVVGDRCLESTLVPKMLSRLFWIGYFICKLKRGYSKMELIAICNQIPMLWALTYQKVIVPIIKDCDLADLTYNNRRFSDRIHGICKFLDITVEKPSHIEKDYYSKVINLHAATAKRCEAICREVDKFFNALLSRYTLRAQTLASDSDVMSVLAASGLTWSNSSYLTALYKVQDMIRGLESNEEDFEVADKVRLIFADARQILQDKKSEYNNHEGRLKDSDDYRTKLVGINRRRSAIDQFAPIWQLKFLQIRLSLLNPRQPRETLAYRGMLRKMLQCVNGVMMSPRYYGSLMKYFRTLEDCILRQDTVVINADISLKDESPSVSEDSKKVNRRYLDMYAAFLVDHLIENIVLDNQVVGWTKLRVTTSDLSSAAPLIPEYAPIIALVSSYCLDIAHLKLNSYQNQSPQLDSLLIYLWRAYVQIKHDPLEDMQDVALAKNFLHARCSESDIIKDIIGDHKCSGPSVACKCIEAYIKLRGPKFEEMISLIKKQADPGDALIIQRAIKLVYFGFYNMLEFAPIFTFDPSLRSREKLEVYISELAHLKLDLHQRNTLYYWKTGENLRLVDISIEEAKLYPFPIRVLVERRCRLEKSIKKLRKEYTNRPKSDDGSLYYELRKEVEIAINRYTKIVDSLVTDVFNYLDSKKPTFRAKRLVLLNTKCRMLIKSLETTIARFKSDYVLYSDITTYYIVGLCFMLQGMRRLYSRLEPKMQINEMGFTHSLVDQFSADIMRVFSFNVFTLSNLDSVANKRALYPILNRVCPVEQVDHIQSLLLKSILIQLNHHIVMTPSDIKRCIPIVQNVADRFHKAWLERKAFLEKYRREQEELYQYKTPSTTLGNPDALDRKTFIEITKKFPIYDYIYKDEVPHKTERQSADEQNLITEAKINNLSRKVDLSMCIDVCKAHYKFMKEASLSLLGHQHKNNQSSAALQSSTGMDHLIRLEAEILYTIMRRCSLNIDKTFDSLSLECHLLQANELIKLLRREPPKLDETKTSSKAIDISDEGAFDIYHDANVREALRLQEFMTRIDARVNELRAHKNFEAHPSLNSITRLTTKISTFLLTDPLMKFVTGAHMLLQNLEEWNQKVPRDAGQHRLTREFDELIELIKSWRGIEVKSWRHCLHRVKKTYIDDSLCDLWFRLYEAFRDPIAVTKAKFVECDLMDDDQDLSPEEESFYQGFLMIIKQFIEESTLGDYQIRLDLVFSFAIQTRFASLFEQSKSEISTSKIDHDRSVPTKQENKHIAKIDYDKLTTYVYNMYRQYQGLMEPLRENLELKEVKFKTQLNEQIRLVNWQGRSAWEIKNNFRISHKKLNDVMSSYLKVLSEPQHMLDNRGLLDHCFDIKLVSKDYQPSEDVVKRYSEMKQSLGSLKIPSESMPMKKFTAIKSAHSITQRMLELTSKVCDYASNRYSTVLIELESGIEENDSSIQSFRSHNVQDLTLDLKDSKEVRAEKIKTCRQMHHSKRFALQTIFKNLQRLGVSHQRGTNNWDHVDRMILSLEPLADMIQDQCNSTMTSMSELVDSSMITSCNQLYQAMVSRVLKFFSNESTSEQLSSDHLERMRGCTADLQLDICRHNRNAAMIYRHMIDIQASATRLRQLQDRYEGSEQIVIYNYSKVHRAIQLFDELLGKTMSSFSRLEVLLECYETYSNLWHESSKITNPGLKAEKSALIDLISEIDERNSLLTETQYEHIKENLGPARETLTGIGSELRDKLKHTIKNHLYDKQDIRHLESLCSNYTKALETLFACIDAKQPNATNRTILGSLKNLLIEAKQKLCPLLQSLERDLGDGVMVDCIPNVDRLNIRIQKLIRQAKLAIQELYKDETDFTTTEFTSESDKRKLKPFNHIDSSRIRDLLRPNHIAKKISKCFMTLNLEQSCNITHLVTRLTPMMTLYTQNLACYLNVILSSIHLKLVSANQLTTFFDHVVSEGFGLPYSEKDLDGMADGNTNGSSKPGEDNTGFGEGQGEKDASKKIEFESQLDELDQTSKNDDHENGDSDKAQNDDQGSVKSNDDGVEMTDDFEAKAHGPDEESENQLDGEDDVPEDQGILDELDKQFDQVDDDEGHLDSKLWDEEGLDDEKLGDDDESDLREASADKSVRPTMDEIDLMAKDENLKASNEDQEEENGGASGKPDDGESADLSNESKQIDNHESISDLNMSDFDDSELRDDGDEIDKAPEESVEMADDYDLPEEKIEPEDLTPDVDNEENEQLSWADEPSKTSDREEMDTNNEDISEEIPTQSDGGDGFEAAQPADSFSAMDASELERNEMEQQSSELKQKQGEKNGGASNQNDDQETEESNAEQVDTVEQGDGGEQLCQEDSNEHDAGSAETNEELSSKRTFAQRESSDDPSLPKRQKIEAAKETGKDQDQADKELGASEVVRHLVEDQSSAIEIIDIAESSDDDLLLGGLNDCQERTDAESASRNLSRQEQLNTQASGDEKSLEQLSEDDEGQKENTGSSYNTNLGLLKYISHSNTQLDQAIAERNNDIMEQIDNDLRASKSASAEHESIEADKLSKLWADCTRNTSHLVHELCQQLQIVLQPTKMSKYRGDYKTGKRLNMRKIISYIASHYRKDKIWLRRTKPNKRTYNISLAVDNSSSMSENNCRSMTYQSLALLAHSLSLIEVGSLNVVKFGERVQCIHEFGQPYMEAIGAQWLKELRFDERRTSYSRLLKFSRESFAMQAQQTIVPADSQNGSVHQLLIIISDGRNITSEEEEVKGYLRQLKSLGVLTLFVIIDDLKRNEGKSIVDVKTCVRIEESENSKGGGGVRIESYMDFFPFPFYVLLRQIETMPSVLGDALRQWFELIINLR